MNAWNDKPGAEAGAGRVVITVTGANRPGVVAAFSKLLAQEGVDIQEFTQRVVSDLFVMLILGSMDDARTSLLELRGRLERLSQDMQLQVSVQHERLFRFINRV